MNKVDIVSVVGAQAKEFVTEKKPSSLIPFRGEFPIISPAERRSFMDAVCDTEYMDQLSDRFRRAIRAGEKMYLMHNGFKEFLSKRGITEDSFAEKTKEDKADMLVQWMDAASLDFNSLNISI